MVKHLVEKSLFLILLNVQIKTKHRIFLPVPVHRVDEESPEELPLPPVEIFQRGEEEAFAESAWTRQKPVLSTVLDNFLQLGGLIHIQGPLPPQFAEVMLAFRVSA